jgi:hypothetical protein
MSIDTVRPEFHDTIAAPREMIELNLEQFPDLGHLSGGSDVPTDPTSPGSTRVPFLALPTPIVGHYRAKRIVLPGAFAPAALQKKGKCDGFYRDLYEVFAGSLHDLWYATNDGWVLVSEKLYVPVEKKRQS